MGHHSVGIARPEHPDYADSILAGNVKPARSFEGSASLERGVNVPPDFDPMSGSGTCSEGGIGLPVLSQTGVLNAERTGEFASHERSIEDVMNEALELWLDAHARQK